MFRMDSSSPGRYRPAYTFLLNKGELAARAKAAAEMLQNCLGCGWDCQVDRTAGKLGVCLSGPEARISSYGAHMGEEKPLSGWRGSGTIFFTRCNLRCQYCQNHTISQTDSGDLTGTEDLAEIMLTLQSAGCHNINLVSPTHFVPQIIAAVWLAAQAGLQLPIVYNTGGYDSPQTLSLLDGIIDIYMPDMKYSSSSVGLKYSKIRNYPQVNQAAVIEMHRQVGDLRINADGVAYRGLLVRHLVLPNQLAGTAEIVQFLAERISKRTYLNLMDQYYPTYRARQFPKLNRRISREEYRQAVDWAHQAGLTRLDKPLRTEHFGL